jgi:hypothetical protein
MCRVYEEPEVEKGVARWNHTMLESWQILMAKMGCRLRVALDQGCLQIGGVSVLWSLVVNGLLAQLSRDGLFSQCYADDFSLLIIGKFPSTFPEQQISRTSDTGFCLSSGETNPVGRN